MGGEYQVNLYTKATNKKTWKDSTFEYTKIDTYQVERGGQLVIQKVPIDGSIKMNNWAMEGLEPYDYSELVPFDMHYLSGHVAERFDDDKDSSIERYRRRIKSSIERAIRGTVKGYTSVEYGKVDYSPTRETAEYALLPAWTLMVSYRNKSYSFTMNGQTGKMVGALPMDWGKIFKTFLPLSLIASVISWIIGGFFL